MTITVTQEHIDKGVKAGCRNCPIALAIRESCGPCFVNNVVVSFPENFRSVYLPVPVRLFIQDFDAGRAVFPFTFELPI